MSFHLLMNFRIGVFGYPQEPAAHVALNTVKQWLTLPQAEAIDLVLFDVFTDNDATIYARLAPAVFAPPPAPQSASVPPSIATVASTSSEPATAQQP